jgi:hypothetical protein
MKIQRKVLGCVLCTGHGITVHTHHSLHTGDGVSRKFQVDLQVKKKSNSVKEKGNHAKLEISFRTGLYPEPGGGMTADDHHRTSLCQFLVSCWLAKPALSAAYRCEVAIHVLRHDCGCSGVSCCGKSGAKPIKTGVSLSSLKFLVGLLCVYMTSLVV